MLSQFKFDKINALFGVNFDLLKSCWCNILDIFEYIRLSKNLQMNIPIYLYWGNGTNMNMNNISGPFYSNIQLFKYSNIQLFDYSCSSLHHYT